MRPIVFLTASVAFAAIAAIGYGVATPALAQGRAGMANTIATDVANKFVAKIQGESCSQFATTMSGMKNNGATPSPMSSKLKSNPGARTTFVNIVGGPLLNKMIDCNMLPGGM